MRPMHLLVFFALLLFSPQGGSKTLQETGTFPAQWIHGAKDCHDPEPVFQVHGYTSDTYILRQNKCANFEAPFLYLLLGKRKALLLDTGADVKGQPPRPLRGLVQGLVASWEKRTGAGPVSLIVAHTHAHGDHRAGDALFAGQPRTTVVEPTIDGVQRFLGLKSWPEGHATLDLGDRPLTVLPLPGHEPTHIAIYDARHQLLLTGDTLYPGLLTVRDWPAYRKSVGRLAAFVATHKVTHVLGAHVEMTRRSREMYPLETTYQPEEHVLQLGAKHVEELHRALETLGDQPGRDVHDDFIIDWIPPRPQAPEGAPPPPAPDRPSVHGMLIVGEKTIFLSHLPLFHSPHDYQVLLEARFRSSTGDPRRLYAEDRARTGEKIYTLVPERFVLPDKVTERRSFQADIYRGHFERGGVPIVKDVTVDLVRVVHFRKFTPRADRPRQLEYVLFGKGDEVFLAHRIIAPPDFDQVLSIRPARPLGDAELAGREVLVFPVREPFRAGESLSAQVQSTGQPLTLSAGTVFYTETSDLAE